MTSYQVFLSTLCPKKLKGMDFQDLRYFPLIAKSAQQRMSWALMSVFSLLQPLQPDQPLLTVNSDGDSFVAVSWTLTPGWETALEGITPKVVSTNLNYMEGFDTGRKFLDHSYPSETYYIVGNGCPHKGYLTGRIQVSGRGCYSQSLCRPNGSPAEEDHTGHRLGRHCS